MDKEKFVDYGMCMGIRGKVKPHKFFDGRKHFKDSHGLCPKCKKVMIDSYKKKNFSPYKTP